MRDGTSDLTALTEPELAGLSAVMSMLSDPTRLRLVLLLCAGERRVSELVEVLRQPQPTVSHHLGLLRRARLLVTRREGKSIFYSLDRRLELAAEGCELRVGNASGVTILISTAAAPAWPPAPAAVGFAAEPPPSLSAPA